MAKAYVSENAEAQAITFFCPGCDDYHTVYTRHTTGDKWSWNGSVDAPTFTPSVFVNSPHGQYYTSHLPSCHSFVTDGKIQFLSDCSHDLACQTIDLPEIKEP